MVFREGHIVRLHALPASDDGLLETASELVDSLVHPLHGPQAPLLGDPYESIRCQEATARRVLDGDVLAQFRNARVTSGEETMHSVPATGASRARLASPDLLCRLDAWLADS